MVWPKLLRYAFNNLFVINLCLNCFLQTAAISSEAEFVKLEKGKQIIESVILGTNQNSEGLLYYMCSFIYVVILTSIKIKCTLPVSSLLLLGSRRM